MQNSKLICNLVVGLKINICEKEKENGKMAGREEMYLGEMEESNWRKEVDSNLKRVHSLAFASDLALQSRDFSSAQILCLRLIGFLDSRSQNDDVDASFILPIRRQALSNLLAARASLLPFSDWYSIHFYLLPSFSSLFLPCITILVLFHFYVVLCNLDA